MSIAGGGAGIGGATYALFQNSMFVKDDVENIDGDRTAVGYAIMSAGFVVLAVGLPMAIYGGRRVSLPRAETTGGVSALRWSF